MADLKTKRLKDERIVPVREGLGIVRGLKHAATEPCGTVRSLRAAGVIGAQVLQNMEALVLRARAVGQRPDDTQERAEAVSYTHLRAHETSAHL
eukprot:7161499-Alexandrium_andersonii.AAC.1